MSKRYFVTGTDTGVGKTLVSAGLLIAANHQGMKTAAFKPVAAGCEIIDDELCNDDALILQQASSLELNYQQVNPVALELAIAPHIALANAVKNVRLSDLKVNFDDLVALQPDICVIEGAGGWRVPLNDDEQISGLAKMLNCPVVLVVGMKLGCINHALLTAEAIAADGLELAGWFANAVDPDMDFYQENLSTLKARLSAPLLGEVPFLDQPMPEVVAKYLELPV